MPPVATHEEGASNAVMRPRRRWLIAALAVVVAAGAAIPAPRHAVLEAVGRQLVYEDAVANPTYVALLSGTGAETLLEVADLAAQSVLAPVILFDTPSPVAAEYARRHVAPPSETEVTRQVLLRLGVGTDRMRIVHAATGGTNDEVAALAADGDLGAGGAVVVSWHHSARLHRIIRRAFDDAARRPGVVVSRYGRSWERAWWSDREYVRVGIMELQKLLVDVVAHPVPDL